MKLFELVSRVPSETEEKVAKTKKRLNDALRRAIRDETGLRLNRRDDEDRRSKDSGQGTTIEVRIVPGLPVSLMGQEIPEEFRIAALLAPWRHHLQSLKDSSTNVSIALRKLSMESQLMEILGGREASLPTVSELAEILLRETKKFDLVKDCIMSVNEDVLGAYFSPVRGNVQRDLFAVQPKQPRIELYWAVIGLVAQALGVSVEALTTVVFAHELGHAYTHLGLDIDVHAWSTSEFAATDHELKEGLAQYYSAMVIERISNLEPDAAAAYEELVPKQPAAYQTHLPWIKEFMPEEVRMAMIEVRRRGVGRVDDFNRGLSIARSRLRPNKSQIAPQAG